MKFIKPTMIIFSALILMLIGFGFAQLCKWEWPAEFGAADWVMSVALGVFCVLIILGAFGQKFNVKRLGSYILHFGFVLFLIGCLIYTVSGEYVMTTVPVNNSVAYGTIQKSDGELLELGFSFGLDNFKIEYYDPVYDVYEMTESGTKTVKTDIQLNEDGVFDFGKYGGKYTLESLADGYGNIREQINLGNNYVALVRRAVKKYTANIAIFNGNERVNKELIVNYPIRENGFKIYLMSYNETNRSATLLFKRDYGEIPSTAGLVLIMGGAFFHCLVYPAIAGKGKKKLPLEREGAEK